MEPLDFAALLREERAKHRSRRGRGQPAAVDPSQEASQAEEVETAPRQTETRPPLVLTPQPAVDPDQEGKMEPLDFAALLREERAKHRSRTGRGQPTAVDPSQELSQAEEVRTPPHPTETRPPLVLAPQPAVDLNQCRVGTIPHVYYVPDFLTDDDERAILGHTYASSSWVVLKTRRLQCWGGRPGDTFSPEPLPPWLEAISDSLVSRGVLGAQDRPNHVLLNEYQPGQGIMQHTDGPYYDGWAATVSLGGDAIMHFSKRLATEEIGRSLSDSGGGGEGGGGAAGAPPRPAQSLVLRRRCLVLFAGDAYAGMLHGIDAVDSEVVGAAGPASTVVNAQAAGATAGEVIRREVRLSLTLRRVATREGPAAS